MLILLISFSGSDHPYEESRPSSEVPIYIPTSSSTSFLSESHSPNNHETEQTFETVVNGAPITIENTSNQMEGNTFLSNIIYSQMISILFFW